MATWRTTAIPRLEALLADIALGNRMPSQVAQALRQGAIAATCCMPMRRRGERILITGAERGVISFAQLLHADPGRRDHGLPQRRQGHRGAPAGMPERGRIPQVARALGARSAGIARSPAIIDAALRIEVENRPGVLAQVAAAIAHAESNIDRVEYLERDTHTAVIALLDRGAATASTWPK